MLLFWNRDIYIYIYACMYIIMYIYIIIRPTFEQSWPFWQHQQMGQLKTYQHLGKETVAWQTTWPLDSFCLHRLEISLIEYGAKNNGKKKKNKCGNFKLQASDKLELGIYFSLQTIPYSPGQSGLWNGWTLSFKNQCVSTSTLMVVWFETRLRQL